MLQKIPIETGLIQYAPPPFNVMCNTFQAWVNGRVEVSQEARELLTKLKQEEVAILRQDHISWLNVKKSEVGLATEQRKELVKNCCSLFFFVCWISELQEMFYRRSFCDDFARRICDNVFDGIFSSSSLQFRNGNPYFAITGYSKIPKPSHPIYPEAVQHLLFQHDKLKVSFFSLWRMLNINTL